MSQVVTLPNACSDHAARPGGNGRASCYRTQYVAIRDRSVPVGSHFCFVEVDQTLGGASRPYRERLNVLVCEVESIHTLQAAFKMVAKVFALELGLLKTVLARQMKRLKEVLDIDNIDLGGAATVSWFDYSAVSQACGAKMRVFHVLIRPSADGITPSVDGLKPGVSIELCSIMERFHLEGGPELECVLIAVKRYNLWAINLVTTPELTYPKKSLQAKLLEMQLNDNDIYFLVSTVLGVKLQFGPPANTGKELMDLVRYGDKICLRRIGRHVRGVRTEQESRKAANHTKTTVIEKSGFDSPHSKFDIFRQQSLRTAHLGCSTWVWCTAHSGGSSGVSIMKIHQLQDGVRLPVPEWLRLPVPEWLRETNHQFILLFYSLGCGARYTTAIFASLIIADKDELQTGVRLGIPLLECSLESGFFLFSKSLLMIFFCQLMESTFEMYDSGVVHGARQYLLTRIAPDDMQLGCGARYTAAQLNRDRGRAANRGSTPHTRMV
ncbi:hypothetical protein B0H19DRAFT_1069025 [Mycena capillaripes]|nr:hypothetical protein B0H19DRAFT_1069025 [Mycena capillaripes]